MEGFSGNGYTSLSIIYAVSAVFNWLAPSAIAVMGIKISIGKTKYRCSIRRTLHKALFLVIGAVTYALFIASFFYLSNAMLYSASALIGVGAALIWTGQVLLSAFS